MDIYSSIIYLPTYLCMSAPIQSQSVITHLNHPLVREFCCIASRFINTLSVTLPYFKPDSYLASQMGAQCSATRSAFLSLHKGVAIPSPPHPLSSFSLSLSLSYLAFSISTFPSLSLSPLLFPSTSLRLSFFLSVPLNLSPLSSTLSFYLSLSLSLSPSLPTISLPLNLPPLSSSLPPLSLFLSICPSLSLPLSRLISFFISLSPSLLSLSPRPNNQTLIARDGAHRPSENTPLKTIKLSDYQDYQTIHL